MGKKLSQKEWEEKFHSLPESQEYRLLSTYANNHIKVRFAHVECGSEFEMQPNNFSGGQRCPVCNGKHRKTTDGFSEEVKRISNGKYALVSEYVNCETKVALLHSVCGKEYIVTPNDFVQGYRCHHCSGNRKLSAEEVTERVFSSSKGKYSVLSTEGYRNVHSKITILHEECEESFMMTYNNFRNGQECPFCVSKERDSKAVRAIKSYLREVGFEVLEEVSVEGLVNPETGRRLRVDIHLPEVDLYIEYDGRQHFFPWDFISGEECLKKIQYLDGVKNEFFSSRHLELLRIPYNKKWKPLLNEYLLAWGYACYE
jgi:hypothetical protein